MGKQVYRVAMCGAGMIANSAHVPAIQDLNGRMQIVSVCDIREEAAAFMGKRLSVPYYTDVVKMIETEKPDVMVVTVSSAFHGETSRAALERGVSVICEKPVTLNYGEAKELYDTADRNHVHFFAAQTARFKQDMISLLEFGQMGVFGDIYYAEGMGLRRRGIPKWGMFHMKKMNGGGAFCDQHILDLFVALTGAPRVKSVSGVAYTKVTPLDNNLYMQNSEAGAYGGDLYVPVKYSESDLDVEEFGAAFIRFENGLTMSVKNAWAVNLPDSKGMNLRICGTKGGFMMPEMKIIQNYGAYRAEVVPQIVDMTHNKIKNWGHWCMYEHILKALDGEEEFSVKREEVLTTSLIFEMFYRSVQENREISADEIAGY